MNISTEELKHVIQTSEIIEGSEKQLLLTALDNITDPANIQPIDFSKCEYCTASVVLTTEGERKCTAKCWQWDEAIDKLMQSGVALEDITPDMLFIDKETN